MKDKNPHPYTVKGKLCSFRTRVNYMTNMGISFNSHSNIYTSVDIIVLNVRY